VSAKSAALLVFIFYGIGAAGAVRGVLSLRCEGEGLGHTMFAAVTWPFAAAMRAGAATYNPAAAVGPANCLVRHRSAETGP